MTRRYSELCVVTAQAPFDDGCTRSTKTDRVKRFIKSVGTCNDVGLPVDDTPDDVIIIAEYDTADADCSVPKTSPPLVRGGRSVKPE